ncbi:MAG: hypothetical protein QN716_01580 [Nitrososphaeraceae archaeon]|nr:hypothetical protein [Nitrososphaeraceae archaeon]
MAKQLMDRELENVKKYVKLSRFLKDYCGIPYNTRTKQKMSNKDSNGNIIGFTALDKVKIKAGFTGLSNQIKADLKHI